MERGGGQEEEGGRLGCSGERRLDWEGDEKEMGQRGEGAPIWHLCLYSPHCIAHCRPGVGWVGPQRRLLGIPSTGWS